MKVLVRRGHAAIRSVQEIPLNNSFATGRLSSCPVGEIDAYATPLQPDGETAYRVRRRLDEGQGLREIARAMDLSWQQVLGVAQTVGSPDFVVNGDHPPAAPRSPEGNPSPSSPSGKGSITFEGG